MYVVPDTRVFREILPDKNRSSINTKGTADRSRVHLLLGPKVVILHILLAKPSDLGPCVTSCWEQILCSWIQPATSAELLLVGVRTS